MILSGEVKELGAQTANLFFVLGLEFAADGVADVGFAVGEVDFFLHEFAEVFFFKFALFLAVLLFEVGDGLQVFFFYFSHFTHVLYLLLHVCDL